MFSRKPQPAATTPEPSNIKVEILIPGQLCQELLVILKQWTITAVLLWSGVMLTGSVPQASAPADPQPANQIHPTECAAPPAMAAEDCH